MLHILRRRICHGLAVVKRADILPSGFSEGIPADFFLYRWVWLLTVFYTIRLGHVPVIYTSWREAQP